MRMMSFFLKQEQYEYLKERAEAAQCSMASLLREAIDQHREQEKAEQT